jgi:hypothetical protein
MVKNCTKSGLVNSRQSMKQNNLPQK